MDSASARELVLAIDGVVEHDHFGRGAYRVASANGKPSRIFMTLWIEMHRAVLMLTPDQQRELHERDPEIFFPVPNKWGENGATFVELSKVNEKQFRSALEIAMGNAASKPRKA